MTTSQTHAPPGVTRPAGPGQDRSKGAAARRHSNRDGRAAWGFLAPSATGFALFTLIPIVGSLVISVFTWPIFGPRTFTGIDNYAGLFIDNPVFWRVMGNTLLFVVLYVPLNIAVSLGIALWISPKVRCRGLYRLAFFLPAVTPMVANALVWRLLYQPKGVFEGVANTLFGVSLPNFLGDAHWAMLAVVLMSVWQGFGYNMLIFSAGLDSIPDSIQEAATLDGVGPIQRLWSITLPMLSPSMFFAMIMTLITSFQVFAQPYVLTAGGPGIATETVVLHLYRTGFQQFDLGTASAIAWLLFAVIMTVTAVQFIGQKRWVHYDD